MRTALFGFCGLVMLLALPAVSMSEEGRWAAVVFEEVEDKFCGGRNFNKLGAWGMAWNAATKKEAQVLAKEGCEKHVPFCHQEYGRSGQARCVALGVATTAHTCSAVNVVVYQSGFGETAQEADDTVCGRWWKAAQKHPRAGVACKIEFNSCRDKP